MRPMLATRGDRVPTGPGWCHEVKWDGMRALVTIADGVVRATSRNGNDVTASFPELGALVGLGHDVVLDGELVALVESRPSFSALARRLKRRGRVGRGEVIPVTLVAFDVLECDGADLRRQTLEVRRSVVEGLGLGDLSGVVQVSPVHDDGALLWEVTRGQGLEGIVSKRWSSRYLEGARSPDWLKFPHRDRTSWVVGGWRPETGSAHRVGSLLVGEPSGDGLRYRGRVGSGVAGRAAGHLAELLGARGRGTSPFLAVPRVDAAGAQWVEPDLVVDVESLGFSSHGRLRQPAFVGVRDDLAPADVTDHVSEDR